MTVDRSTLEKWERVRQKDAEWNHQYNENLKSAIDKIYLSLEPTRRRIRAFSRAELRALQMFIRKHYNE